MPKNQFQRPQQVAHKHSVPRHGAPLPIRKVEARKPGAPQKDSATLPTLDVLLDKIGKH